MSTIINASELFKYTGCDFLISLPKERKNTKIRLLQITDMQIIDSSQRRTPDRIRIDEINAWAPQNFDAQCGNQIRALATQTKPDLIFITGDIIYGSFDDSGTTLKWFCELMDSLEIPWAPVFGNHDNESRKGVSWQCEQFEKSRWCVFKRGAVSGNGNYTIGISVDGVLVRALHMLDSNGCADSDEDIVIKEKGIFKDQLELIRQNTNRIKRVYKRDVPAFCAFHIPTEEFKKAEIFNGYVDDNREFYTIGVDVQQKNDDFGFKMENYGCIKTEENFAAVMRECNVEAVFAGHCHNINTCISYDGIKWVFGLKTGQYDYHIPGQIGGTLVTLENKSFDVTHVPALVPCAPFPGGAKMFEKFFAESKFLLEGIK